MRVKLLITITPDLGRSDGNWPVNGQWNRKTSGGDCLLSWMVPRGTITIINLCLQLLSWSSLCVIKVLRMC